MADNIIPHLHRTATNDDSRRVSGAAHEISFDRTWPVSIQRSVHHDARPFGINDNIVGDSPGGIELDLDSVADFRICRVYALDKIPLDDQVKNLTSDSV